MSHFTLGRGRNGFTMTELLIVIVIIGILAAIATPIYLNQRQKAKDAAVKEGIHTIALGIQSYASDSDDVYPAAATKATIGNYISMWPRNPFVTGAPDMAPGTTPGTYTYTQGSGSASYFIAGHLHSGGGDFTMP
jgi:type IV pilus assembly protein PilA